MEVSRLPYLHGADGAQVVFFLCLCGAFLWALYELQRIRYGSRIERNKDRADRPEEGGA